MKPIIFYSFRTRKALEQLKAGLIMDSKDFLKRIKLLNLPPVKLGILEIQANKVMLCAMTKMPTVIELRYS